MANSNVSIFPTNRKMAFSPWLLKSIFALLLKDPDYCDRFFSVLNPEHFKTDDGLLYTLAKALWSLNEKYGKFPSEDVLIEEVFVQRGKNIELFTNEPSEEQITALKDLFLNILETEVSDPKYIEDNTTRILSFLSVHKIVTENRLNFISGNLDAEEFSKEIINATSFAAPVKLGVNLYENLDERTNKRIESPLTPGRVTFTIPNLSDNFEDGGIVPGSLCYWLAPTNGGKSSALIFVAKEAAFYDNHNVLYVSAELTEEMVKQRFDACITGIPIREIRKQAAKVKQLYNTSVTYQKMAKNIRVIEVPIGSTSVQDIVTIMDRLEKKDGFKAGVLVVDYADNLKSRKKTDQYRLEVGSIYKDLKEVAKSKNIVVWTASQMNDAGTEASEKENGSISTRHSNEARSKAHDADVIIGIARTQKEKDMGMARLVLVKNRLGGGDGHTVRIFPEFSKARLFTGKVENAYTLDPEQPIEGMDVNVAKDTGEDIYKD